MAESADFVRLFSGDISQVPEPMRKVGWATGYALSIFGNGYGDGRAVSVLEAVAFELLFIIFNIRGLGILVPVVLPIVVS